MSKSELQIGKLSVRESPVHNYGVFAEQEFECNDIVEECHVVICKGDDVGLRNYYFKLDRVVTFLPLGFGAIYNHSPQPNTVFEFDVEKSLMCIYAMEPIKKGEEIFVNYGDDWFSMRKMNMKKLSNQFIIRKLSRLFFRFLMVIGACIFLVLLIQRGIMPFKFF